MVIPNDSRTGVPLGYGGKLLVLTGAGLMHKNRHAFCHFSTHIDADAAMERFQGDTIGGIGCEAFYVASLSST